MSSSDRAQLAESHGHRQVLEGRSLEVGLDRAVPALGGGKGVPVVEPVLVCDQLERERVSDLDAGSGEVPAKQASPVLGKGRCHEETFPCGDAR